MQPLLLRLAVGLLPVLGFLAALVFLDSFKLVRLRAIVGTILAGAAMGAVSYVVNTGLLPLTGLEFLTYSRYVSPLVEESLKGAMLVFLIRTSRVGFLVDAAIFGFAAGAGFAMLENVYYLGMLPAENPAIWIVRGFGTAIVHGGATAIFAMSAKALGEHRRWAGARGFLPGLAVAVLLHSLFNHFFLNPIVSTAALLVVLPPLLHVVFLRSEGALRQWLNLGFDADAELLALIRTGAISDSPVGAYLHTLRERFRGEVVADLLCYLRVHLELSLRAKGLLMMREAGFRAAADEGTRAALQELAFLERSIGRTGRLALSPFLRMSGKDLWQIYMLQT